MNLIHNNSWVTPVARVCGAAVFALSLLLAWGLSPVAQAADTDLFNLEPVQAPARILVVVDSSGSMAEIENFSRNEVQNAGYNGDCTGQQTYQDRDPRNPRVIIGQFTLNNAERKICIVRQILLDFLDPQQADADRLWPDDFEVGLARYAEPGAVIVEPVAPLSQNRQQLIDAVNSLGANGRTPLVGSYLEAAEYLTGGEAITRDSHESDSAVWAADGGFDSYRYGGVNLGPQCGVVNNHLVFLTDGESTCEKGSALSSFERSNLCQDGHPSDPIRDTLGQRVNEFVTSQENQYHPECPATMSSSNLKPQDQEGDYWGCLSLLSGRLANNTTTDGMGAGVNTHVIAYDMGAASTEVRDGMNAWATNGGGLFVAANNSADLSDAFDAINEQAVLPGTYVVASGGVGVSQLNRFTHMDEMYFSMFTPSTKPFWYGNLKQYFFQVEEDGDVGIYTNQNKTTEAVEEGEFLGGVNSPWSDVEPAFYNTNQIVTVDGDIAHIGGAASQIEQPDDRRLFVYYDDTRYEMTSADTTDLTALRGELSADYSDLLVAANGSADAALVSSYETDLLTPALDWLRGVDVNDEWIRLSQHVNPELRPQNPTDNRGADNNDLRQFYGAPLHSTPVLVNYRSRTAGGEPLSDTDDVVFVSTNDGKLYAVDSDTGEEHLAYMPEAILKRPAVNQNSALERMYEATRPLAADGELIYGLDSTWTVWRQDVDRNGNIDENSADFVYLFGGMRRGGRNYYILDATKVQQSEEISEVAVLEGGTGVFEDNGQSWSEPQLAIIRYNGTPTAVFIIGGGYDPAYDAAQPQSLPAQGAQIYIIAARNYSNGSVTQQAGEVLWWASAENSNNVSDSSRHQQIPALQYSIPSAVKTLDRNGDGYLDHFYVGDMGGQLLRFDIDNDNSGASDLVANTDDVVVAQLGISAAENPASAPAADDRRFFHPPSIAMMRCPLGNCVGIAMGSGWRSNPTDDTVTEKFYFLRDYAPFGREQEVINETATGSDGSTLVVQPVSRTADPDAVTAADDSGAVLGYSLTLGGNAYPAEKLLGTPLIVGGRAFFSTYYRPDEAPEACQVGVGAAALYQFAPGDEQALILRDDLSQNVAGSLTALISELPPPEVDENGETPGTDPLIRGGILSGTGSVGPAPLRLDVIRKTRWFQMSP